MITTRIPVAQATDLLQVRALTEELARALSPEDHVVQSMRDASPTLWHRAHTSWFFREFLLEPARVQAFDASFRYLFNSYYDGVGPRHPRAARGMIARPGSAEIGLYRRNVDDALGRLCAGGGSCEQADARASGFTSSRPYLRNVALRAAYRLVPGRVRRRTYRLLVGTRGEQLERRKGRDPASVSPAGRPVGSRVEVTSSSAHPLTPSR